MKTIEQILEENTGLSAMNFMRTTDEEFEKFFVENNVEWIRELLRENNGEWDAEVSEEIHFKKI